MKQFKLPDPGEGLVEAEIVTWRVAEGDEVQVNDILVEIETSKSLVELPSPWSGTVAKILVPEGQTVAVGTPIIEVDDGSEDDPAAAAGGGSTAQGSSAQGSSAQGSSAQAPGEAGEGGAVGAAEAAEPMLVGYGSSGGGTGRRRRGRGQGPSSDDAEAARQVAQSYDQHEPGRRPDEVQPGHQVHAEAHGHPLPRPGDPPRGTDIVFVGGPAVAKAKPPVRMLAKVLGVDLSTVTPTGPDGTITRGDVEAAAALADLQVRGGFGPSSDQGESIGGTTFTETFEDATTDAAGTFGPGPFTEDATRGTSAGPRPGAAGGEHREPIRGVRKVTAQAMAESITKHVHVTEWVDIDVTATMALVEQLKGRREFAGLRVSPLIVYAKVVCLALRRHPVLNASWDEPNGEIVFHHDVNLGVAAATPRGLMVPNVKAAQRMSLVELCTALNGLVQISREGKLQPADYSGGTFTITNVGVFGVNAGTPIINRDESAILCMGSIDRRPWVVGTGADERIEPRWVTTVSITFDHKLIDGEQGSQFLHDVAQLLENPQLALLY